VSATELLVSIPTYAIFDRARERAIPPLIYLRVW
jgi:hypothetical protein